MCSTQQPSFRVWAEHGLVKWLPCYVRYIRVKLRKTTRSSKAGVGKHKSIYILIKHVNPLSPLSTKYNPWHNRLILFHSAFLYSLPFPDKQLCAYKMHLKNNFRLQILNHIKTFQPLCFFKRKVDKGGDLVDARHTFGSSSAGDKAAPFIQIYVKIQQHSTSPHLSAPLWKSPRLHCCVSRVQTVGLGDRDSWRI